MWPKSSFAVPFTANCGTAFWPAGRIVISVSMLLLRMTAVDVPVTPVIPPAMPFGDVSVAGLSTPATRPSVRKSSQFLSTPTAANRSGATL